MPFPPTPSITPSNTCTPSITASNTPTYTPSQTSCPATELIPVYITSNACGNFDLSAYTNSVSYDGDLYALDNRSIIFSGGVYYYACIPVQLPYVGLNYRFDITIDPNLALCAVDGYQYDRIDYDIVSYLGIIGGFEYYGSNESYYLGGVLQNVITGIPIAIYQQTIETCNITLTGLFPQFEVIINTITPTPTISNTPTLTPSITSTITSTPTITPSPTGTSGLTPTITATQTITPTITNTSTPSQTPSQTATATNTPSQTATSTMTPTPSLTPVLCNCIEAITYNPLGCTIEYMNCDGNTSYYIIPGEDVGLEFSFCGSLPVVVVGTGVALDTGVACIGGACPPPPSPTTTSTPSQTPSQTATQTQTPSMTPTNECLCFSSVTVNVSEAGNITFNDCNGNPTIENFNPGDNQTYGDGTFCIQKDTNGGTAMYTIVSYNDCCSIPPPSSTPTQTQTPSPSPTTSVETCAFLTVRTDASLDVPITAVEVNSVPVTYLSGETFTIIPADPPGYFNTTQTGSSVNVIVNYGSNIAGQRIELVDCDAVIHCCDLNPGGGTCTFTGVNLSCNCNWEITGYDGTC